MSNFFIVCSEIGKDKGGIQNWMFFIKLLIEKQGNNVSVFSYKNYQVLEFKKVLSADFFLLSTFKMLVFVFPLIFFAKKKFFIFVHGNEVLDSGFMLKFFLKRILFKKNIFFVANSKAISELFFNNFNRKIDFVQPPFIDVSNSKCSSKIMSSSAVRFLTISRLVERKNIQSVIIALSRLRESGLSFFYSVAGDGPELSNLKSLVDQLGLQDNVEFLGRVSEEKKDTLYSSSDFFLLPSIFNHQTGSIEGYGIVFIEANSYGLPVLSGNTGGMIEAVVDGKTGFHSDGSVNDIMSKINALLSADFNRDEIFNHALKHDYIHQDAFLAFLEKRMNE
jgi:glycosyltransferase involved in cell wall biosynthesis